MLNMQLIGYILIVIILGFFALWIWRTKTQKGAIGKNVEGVQVFDVLVKGVYSPNVITAKVGQKIRINFRREESVDCSRFVNFSDWHIHKELPEGKTVSLEIIADRKGEFIFTCDMSMYQGRLIVE